MLDAHTPQQLRLIWQELASENGGSLPGTSTIYHFGWSNKLKQFVRYVFRSEKSFQSECYPDWGIGIKPQPKDTDGFSWHKTVGALLSRPESKREDQRPD